MQELQSLQLRVCIYIEIIMFQKNGSEFQMHIGVNEEEGRNIAI